MNLEMSRLSLHLLQAELTQFALGCPESWTAFWGLSSLQQHWHISVAAGALLCSQPRILFAFFKVTSCWQFIITPWSVMTAVTPCISSWQLPEQNWNFNCSLYYFCTPRVHLVSSAQVRCFFLCEAPVFSFSDGPSQLYWCLVLPPARKALCLQIRFLSKSFWMVPLSFGHFYDSEFCSKFFQWRFL